MLDPRLDAARDVEVSAGRCGGRRRARMTCLHWPFPGAHGRIRPGAGEREACQAGCVGLRPWRPLLVLGALLVLALADVLLCGVDSTVDLVVVLMVGVALGDSRYFIDPFSACSGCSSA